jgi:hypothetical protein
MSRRRPPFTSTTETPADEEGTDEDQADTADTSLDDLVSGADPQSFDATFNVTRDDIPVATGSQFPVPRPWQGIPRLAFVVNLNYVWNAEAEEWERDTGNRNGGGGRAFDTVDQVDASTDPEPHDIAPPNSKTLFVNTTNDPFDAVMPTDPANGEIIAVGNQNNSIEEVNITAPSQANNFNNGQFSQIFLNAGEAVEYAYSEQADSWFGVITV